MATLYFPSLRDADAVEVEFLRPDGGLALLRLLVDSGFTGQSSFVLGDSASELIQAAGPPSQAARALQGVQRRGWVICRIPALSFQQMLIAIVTDLSFLSLPAGVAGVVGLRFLRQFARWGAEQTGEGDWRFFLANGED